MGILYPILCLIVVTLDVPAKMTEQLSKQVDTLTHQLTDLKADVAKKGGTIDSLNHRLGEKDKQIANLTIELGQRTQHLNSLDHFVRGHLDSLTSRIKILESTVAFTVRFRNDSVGSHTGPVHHCHVLKFDVIEYENGGQNYNTSTGLFTAPVSGTYAFFVTITRNDPDHNHCVEATISKNQGKVQLTTAAACPPGYTSGSNMAVTYLDKGNTVRIETQQWRQIFGHTHTTFSGIKI
ncbi:C1q-related factor-like [Littorina saxatilis]|uniref:C1q-related factor-like n=1 Tax=Littorina saxatilis TaxID=31220 RepID=UPI0038B4E14D